MSEIDWSKAPEWADRVVQLGVGKNLAWACDRKYKYLSGVGPFLFFDDPTDGFMLCQTVVVESRPRPSPAWSGEGLPPAGSDCEFSHQGTGGEWIKCHVVGYHLGHLYGYCPENEWFMEKHDGACHLFIDASVKFRPIRTPEQIAEDERKSEISFMASCIAHSNCRHAPTGHDIAAAAHLHYLGYRKQ